MILFDFSFLFSFYSVKDQISFFKFQSKQVFVFLKRSVCVF